MNRASQNNSYNISKKILIIGPDFKNHRGGIGAVINEHKNLLKNSKFYCSYKVLSSWKSILYSLFKIILFPFYLLFNSNIKIIHLHGASRGSFYRKYYYFFISKIIFNKKVIYHIHGGEFHIFIKESSEFLIKHINNIIYKSDKLIVLSEWWVDYFKNKFPDKKITKLYNSVPIQSVINRSNPSKKISFLFLGLISNNKGCYDILNVAEKLVNRKVDFEINIGGNGESEKLCKIISEKNLSKVVNYLGWISGDKKNEIFQKSNVYLLPSKNEGLPVSILEAMSFGLPVISTRVGGIPEMIEENKSGFIIEPGDLNALEEKMMYFIENKDKINQMGNISKTIVDNKFSNEIIEKQLTKLYCELLNTSKK
jgi:glycosyltransferase involved in cell wall biosynthesis